MNKKVIILTSKDKIINFTLINNLKKNSNIKILSVISLKENNTIKKKIKLIFLLNIQNIVEILYKLLIGLFSNKNLIKNSVFYKNINSKITIDYINSLKSELVICINCPQILTNNTIKLIKAPLYNFHPGDIPSYRGVFIPFFLLKNKINKACLTFHKISVEIDSGEVINKKYYDIENSDNIYSIYKKIFISVEAISFITECIEHSNKLNFQINPEDENRYYTYPNLKEILMFRLGL
tara:strand:- start:818 stop:1528 length:711 start_codon:yes stop_codon:yes gene_type:complete